MGDPERPWWERALNWGGTKADEIASVVGDGAGVIDAAGDLAKAGNKAFAGAPDIGPVGDIADIVSGGGKMLHWDEQGNWDPNWGGVGDIVAGGAGLMSGKTGPGPAAAIGGTAQALANGYQAYTKFSAMSAETDPEKKKQLEHDAWGSTGDATIGALHAGLGSWCPMAELYISAGEFALDGLGTAAGYIGGEDAKFGAGDVVGGLLDAIIPEEEDAWSNQAGNWVDNAVGGGTLGTVLGATTAGLTNVVAAPLNIADATAGGIVNTLGNMFDSDDGKRDDYWGDFKGWTGDKAGEAWDWTKGAAGDAWDWTKGAANTVADGAGAAWDWTKDTAGSVADTVSGAAGDAWDWTKGAASTVADGAGAAWDWTKDTAGSVADTVSQGASDAWDWTKGAASTVADGAGAAWDWTKDTAGSVADTVSGAAGDAWDWTKGAASTVGGGISDAASWVGDGAASVGGAIMSFLSDERFKQDIHPIESALDVLLAL